jgi:hypothetical protein
MNKPIPIALISAALFGVSTPLAKLLVEEASIVCRGNVVEIGAIATGGSGMPGPNDI